jgi:hypothetical protein
MRRRTRLLALGGCLLAIIIPPTASRGEIIGPAYEAEYSTRFTAPDVYPIASITLDPIMSRVSRVGGEYQVYPLLLETGEAPLLLSYTEDRFVVYAGTEAVDGLIDIAATDPELWESLDNVAREAFLYPGDVAPYGVVQVYILTPALLGDQAPHRFEFTVSSLDRTLVLETAPQTAD